MGLWAGVPWGCAEASGNPPVLAAWPAGEITIDGKLDDWPATAKGVAAAGEGVRVRVAWDARGLILGVAMSLGPREAADWGAVSGGPRIRLIAGGEEQGRIIPEPRPGRRSIAIVDTGTTGVCVYRIGAGVGQHLGALAGPAAAVRAGDTFRLEAVIGWDAVASAPEPGRWSRLAVEVWLSPDEAGPIWTWPGRSGFGPRTGHLLVAQHLGFWICPQRYVVEKGDSLLLAAECSEDGAPLEVLARPATTDGRGVLPDAEARTLRTDVLTLSAGPQTVQAATDDLAPGAYVVQATAGGEDEPVPSMPAALLVLEREHREELEPGEADATPLARAAAGLRNRVLVRWAVDAAGLPAGARIGLRAPEGWTAAQTEMREAPGFVACWSRQASALPAAGEAGADFSVQEALPPGEVVRFVYGDSLEGAMAPRAATTEERPAGRFELVISSGAEVRRIGPEGLAVPILPASPRRLRVHAPAKVKVGRPFAVTLEAVDRFDNTTPSYRGKVLLRAEGPAGEVKDAVKEPVLERDKWSEGRLNVEGAARLDEPGIYRLQAWAPHGALEGESQEITAE